MGFNSAFKGLNHEVPSHNVAVVVWYALGVSRIFGYIYFETANVH
jgi:hypothetical protein